MLVPNTAIPTMDNPITAPPKYATGRALSNPFLALFAVLAFALTAAFIPKYAAAVVQSDPRMYAIAR